LFENDGFTPLPDPPAGIPINGVRYEGPDNIWAASVVEDWVRRPSMRDPGGQVSHSDGQSWEGLGAAGPTGVHGPAWPPDGSVVEDWVRRPSMRDPGGQVIHYDGQSWKRLGADVTTEVLDPHWPLDDVWMGCGSHSRHFDGTVARPLGVPLPFTTACTFYRGR